ncbi:MAG: R3H domain-containing nucleic acid-binding protein [Patescibacteria group bacterium]
MEETQVTTTNSKAIECAREFLVAMNVDARVEEGVIGDSVALLIRTDDASLLIGENGANLQALNYILRRVIERKTGTPEAQLMIDVNDYQRRRFDDLRDKARMGAQRVRYFKKEVTLEPMTAFERRIVHMALQEYPDIATTSVGEGPTRRVMIKLLAI